MNEDSYTTYGITDDFAWYELTAMSNKLRELASRFENMERVLKTRSKEQAMVYGQLVSKLRDLTEENAALKGEK